MRKKIDLKYALPGDLFTGSYTGVRVVDAPLRLGPYGRLVVGGDEDHRSMFGVRTSRWFLCPGVDVELITREVELPTRLGAVVEWRDDGLTCRAMLADQSWGGWMVTPRDDSVSWAWKTSGGLLDLIGDAEWKVALEGVNNA